MIVPEASIKELADFLKSRKNQGQRVGLFLGNRTGVLYDEKLYKILKSHIVIAEDLLKLLKRTSPLARELSMMVQHTQNLAKANVAAPDRFKQCYEFLGRHFSENAIHSIFFDVLTSTRLREEDKLLAALIMSEFFDTIINTNIDTLLEEACILQEMKEPEDYSLFLCGTHDSRTIGQKSSRCGQIVKVFGDFVSLKYNTVGNEFTLEADQPLEQFLKSKLSKDIIVLGYDPVWDQPLERAFQEKGGMIWYVNEEQPIPNTHFANVLNQGYSKYLWGPGWNYNSFLQTLTDLVGGKAVQEPAKIKVPAFSSQSSHPVRKKAFISYSHNDKVYLERLRVHLKGYSHVKGKKNTLQFEKDSLKILCDNDWDNVWDDTKISIGANWQEEIEKALAQAKIAVCLVSADFFGSDFIHEKELPVLYKAARANQVQLVSLIISPCGFEESDLFMYQTVNPPNEPLIKMGIYEQEVIWDKLAKHIFLQF